MIDLRISGQSRAYVILNYIRYPFRGICHASYKNQFKSVGLIIIASLNLKVQLDTFKIVCAFIRVSVFNASYEMNPLLL